MLRPHSKVSASSFCRHFLVFAPTLRARARSWFEGTPGCGKSVSELKSTCNKVSNTLQLSACVQQADSFKHLLGGL